MNNTIKKINPSELFSNDILNFEVETENLGKIKYVNLDNAATTPPLKVVEDGITNYLKSYGSVHRGAGTKSIISTDIYEESRETIKEFVNAPKDSYVILTGNTTGAMNTLSHFFSFISGKVLVSSIEHSSSWLPWIKSEGIKLLGKRKASVDEMGIVNEKIQKLGKENVLRYDVNEKFEFDLESIEDQLRENKIKALVLTASSNVTGYCPDIKKIGKLAHKHGAYFIVDACQYIQHHTIDMQELGIDFLLASGHKFYAPYGGGFLIGPKKFLDKFLPYQIGGGNLPYITKEGEFLRYFNQQAHDPGTPNAVGTIAMGLALEKIKDIGIENIKKHERKLTRKIYEYMISNPKLKIHVEESHLNTVIPFNIIGQDAHEVADKLNKQFGIGVRAGSFCAYNVVRKLLNIYDDKSIIELVKSGDTSLIPAVIRISIGLENDESDIKRIIFALEKLTTINGSDTCS